MKKKWVDPDDAPPLTGREIHRPDAKWRIGRKAVSPEEGRAAFRTALGQGKTRVNIHLDNDVISHFKLKAGDRGYQTLINAALRQIVDRERSSRGADTSAQASDITRPTNLFEQTVLQELSAIKQAIADTKAPADPSARSHLIVVSMATLTSQAQGANEVPSVTRGNNDLQATRSSGTFNS